MGCHSVEGLEGTWANPPAPPDSPAAPYAEVLSGAWLQSARQRPISFMRKPDAKVEFNMPEIVGYCRVSTDGQTLDAQIAELKAAGATKLFAEKQSGARSDRPQLRKALAALGEGDVLMVTRLDRLARSTRDLLNVLHEVARSSAAFKSRLDCVCWNEHLRVSNHR